MVLGQSVSLGAVEFGRLRAGLGPAGAAPDAACFTIRAEDVTGRERRNRSKAQGLHSRKKRRFYVFGRLARSDAGVGLGESLVHGGLLLQISGADNAADEERKQPKEAENEAPGGGAMGGCKSVHLCSLGGFLVTVKPGRGVVICCRPAHPLTVF